MPLSTSFTRMPGRGSVPSSLSCCDHALSIVGPGSSAVIAQVVRLSEFHQIAEQIIAVVVILVVDVVAGTNSLAAELLKDVFVESDMSALAGNRDVRIEVARSLGLMPRPAVVYYFPFPLLNNDSSVHE